MRVIKLAPEQVGEYDADGTMIKRPTRDTEGHDITALHGTIKHLPLNGTLYFVTIPTGKDHPDITYQLPGAEAPKPAPKPKD